MTTAYNPMYTHRLEPISGFDEITHLQFIAPMDTTDLDRNNGSGEEKGLPAGSVVSLNEDHAFTAGAVGTAMPCFLLWNTADPDGYPSALTANGQHLAGIAATGAARENQGSVLDSAELIRNLYQRDSSRIKQTAAGANGGTDTYSAIAADTGLAGSVGDRNDFGGAGTVISYKLRKCAGNFTAWPATCGLELNSTEFDKGLAASAFVPNALLTSPRPIAKATAESQAAALGTTDAQIEAIAYQRIRGGYITTVKQADFFAREHAFTASDNAAEPTYTPSFNPETDLVNVCGTVSKGIHRNENGVLVLYFWAERTIFPKVIAQTT